MTTHYFHNECQCGAGVGELHQGCEFEQCSACGLPPFYCVCRKNAEAVAYQQKHRLPFAGHLPVGLVDCLQLNWFCDSDGEQWKDFTFHSSGSHPDINRLYREAKWDRAKRQFVAPSPQRQDG